MSALVAPRTARKAKWRLIAAVGLVVLLWSSITAAVAVPAVGTLIVLAAGVGLAAWLTRYDPTEAPGPAPARVRLSDTILLGTALTALVAAGHASPVTAALLTFTVTTVTGLVARRQIDNGSRLALLPSGWLLTVRAHRAAGVAAVLGALILTGTLAGTGVAWAGLVGATVLLLPARSAWGAANREQVLRGDVQASLCGAFTGGSEWTRVLELSGRAPIRALRTDGEVPTEVVLPLPPSFTAARQDDVETEIAARLKPWGQYVCRYSTGRDRLAIATRVKPLPTHLVYDGRPAVEGTQVWLGTGLATREHTNAPGTAGITNGEPFPFTVDYRTEPHSLLVGTTGAGKSVTAQLIMIQLLRAGWNLLLVDPKRVEFTRWSGRPGVLRVTTAMDDHVELLEAARAEMESRYARLTAAGVNHIDLMPTGERPRRVLVVVDEIAELLSPVAGKSDEAKALNEAKGRCADAIGSILRLGRAAGVHVLAAAQRADKQTVLSGESQNNIALRVLHGNALQTERTMIGLGDVTASPGIRGRAVARTISIPQTELQVAYFGPDDLDRWLPLGADQPAMTVPEHPVIEPPLSLPVVPARPVIPVQPRNTPARGGNADDGDGTATRSTGPDGETGLRAARPVLTFDHVGGYATVKAELLDTVGTALNDSHSAAAYRIQTGGVLLYGPPGTGKTFLAEALAGTLGVNFLKVSVADLTSKWIGEGAEKIKAAVDVALAAAPCILLIDEVDAVAGRRDDESGGGDAKKNVNALLVQLDRLKAAPGVVVLATTNLVESLDPAVIRDGRFSARIRVDLPDLAARPSILRTACEGRPVEVIDYDRVAGLTAGYSAAMLVEVVNGAARFALRGGRTIDTDDLVQAIEERGGQDRPTTEQAGLDGLVLTAQTEADLRSVLGLLVDPARAAAFGIKVPTGLLLAGPPGTGKTSIAKALAAEAQTSFYAIAPGEPTSKWQGEAEAKVRQLFERARANAPSIVFVDEIDSFAATRGTDSGGGERILTALLAEVDGFAGGAAGGSPVFVIAATNRPDILDPALTRPGRLSRTVTIGLPDVPARLALLTRMTAGMPLAPDVDLSLLAEVTDGFSPAGLRGLCEEAAVRAMQTLGPDDEPLVGAGAFVAVLDPAATGPV